MNPVMTPPFQYHSGTQPTYNGPTTSGLSVTKSGPDLLTAADNIEQALDRIAQLIDGLDGCVYRLGATEAEAAGLSPAEPIPSGLAARLDQVSGRANRLANRLENDLRRLNGLI